MEQSKKSLVTRTKILESGEAEFSEKGLAAARVDEIAQRAGVNKRMVYAHFESKEGLYRSVLSAVYSRLAEYEKKLEEMEFVGLSSIRQAIIMYFDFLMNNESFVRLVLWENLEGAKYISESGASLFSGIEKLLTKGVQKGIVRDDIDIRQTAMSCNMFCFSAFSNAYTLSKMLSLDLTGEESMIKRREHIADVLTNYIAK